MWEPDRLKPQEVGKLLSLSFIFRILLDLDTENVALSPVSLLGGLESIFFALKEL